MKESQILALAESLANGQAEGERPTEEDFAQAEREIRTAVAEGLTFDYESGDWVRPDGD